MSKYIYWIGTGESQSGSYKTREEAERAIKDGQANGWLNPDIEIKVIPHEVDICPTCHQEAEKDIIDGVGECLNCDHVRGDYEADRRMGYDDEESVEYND